ncbi:MAG: oligosaccharide flippase family protein [Bacteroidia bacterium]
MLKNLLKDGLIYTISNFLLKGISFFLLPFYTRVLTPLDYGVIDLLATLFSLISVTVCLEITQAVGRYLPEFNENSVIKLIIARTGIWFTIMMNLILMFIFIFFSENISEILFGSKSLHFVVKLSGINLFFYGILYAAQNQLRWQLMAKQNVIIAILTSLVTILTTIYFVLYCKLGVTGVILGQVVGSFFGSIIAIYLIKESFIPQINLKFLKKMLGYSVPLVFSSAAIILSQYIDRIAINYYLGVEEVGLYGVSFRIANIINLALSGFSISLTPLIINNYKKADTAYQISKIFGYFLFISLFMIISISLFADLIFTYFISFNYYQSIFVLPYILFSVFFNGSYIFAPGLNLSGKTKQITYLNILSLMINVVFNAILLNTIGFIGAGIATFIASIFFIVSMFHLSNKYYKIPYQFKKVLTILIPFFMVCIFFQYIKLNLIIETLIKLIIICIFIFCCFYMNFISKKDIQILKNKLILNFRFKIV